MKNRTVTEALVCDIPSPDLVRARQLITICLGMWLIIGILVAMQGSSFA